MDNHSNNELNTSLPSTKILSPEQLTLTIPNASFSFTNTESLLDENAGIKESADLNAAWLLQAEAYQAAKFGLAIDQPRFNILALGEPGVGRTTLMLNAMHEAAKGRVCKTDLIALYQFDNSVNPLILHVPVGQGVALKQAFDDFVKTLSKALATLLDEKVTPELLAPVKKIVEANLAEVKKNITVDEVLDAHIQHIQADLLDYINAWQSSGASTEGDAHIEAMLNESFMGRYRVNVLVANKKGAPSPVILDNDPSLQSLFGGIEAAGDNNVAEFMRLRAGHLLRADGGAILINLRDIIADEQNGPQILEKLHRFFRNNTLFIEDLSSGQASSAVSAQTPIPVSVKFVLVASREEYYALLEEKPDFFSFFPIKVEFCETVKATQSHYDAFALWVAKKCASMKSKHFTPEAVVQLLQVMHRLEEDQTRLSTQLNILEHLVIESVAVANSSPSEVVSLAHVKTAIAKRDKRHGYVESQIRASIVDQELMINVFGEAIGQVNGLTHVDLSEASFGSPARISANCYAGSNGVINIAREVTMSGPTHDKGMMIMQSWLLNHFSGLNPLNFTASLVFEQEYAGVDGDSASCAELFALISSLSQLPINQSIAVTGAMNQHGEVLPVGGLNDKIEGYFSVCKDLGLNGQHGVLIPEKNQRHLMLNDDVIKAVQEGQFHIATMARVEDGLAYLMKSSMNEINAHSTARLQQFKEVIESNKPIQQIKN